MHSSDLSLHILCQEIILINKHFVSFTIACSNYTADVEFSWGRGLQLEIPKFKTEDNGQPSNNLFNYFFSYVLVCSGLA